ncbi:MAG: RDD family protein [Ignavibacteriaceae bacterium]
MSEDNREPAELNKPSSHKKTFCINHPQKIALSFCHHCQEYFCDECLNEGLVYYYCNKEECKKQYLLQKPPKSTLDNFDLPYSDIFSRMIALLIDGLILFVFNSIIAFVFNLEVKDIIAQFGIMVIFRHPLFLITGLIYYAVMESSKKQATFGKLSQNLVVTNLQGERINILQSIARNFSKIFSTLIFFIGYVMPAFTTRKQALHDLIASTLVIKINKDVLPIEIICAECNENISLSIQERILNEYDCPTCKKKIKING